MSANIELKAKLANMPAAHEVARRLSGSSGEQLVQTDIFFAVSKGRLKLRIFGDNKGELIHYSRENIAEARRSDYIIVGTSDPWALCSLLDLVTRQIGTVRKTRYLYLLGQTRIHVDDVEDLGTFLEIEVVLTDSQSEQEARVIADDLLVAFGVPKESILADAYIDMLVSLDG